MFDPFRDFHTAGYLRNFAGEKDPDIVKMAEHELFRANLPDAVGYLVRRKIITYPDFLKVHEILFKGFYPWAGKDRIQIAPDRSINKGETVFASPPDAVRAVTHGLRLGQDAPSMRARPGEVMGLFAFGHPFLDGNGRTMLLVHAELCRRAGFSILWQNTSKAAYLRALTLEIASPAERPLDAYLLQFVGEVQEKEGWLRSANALQGLDGGRAPDQIGGDFSDPAVIAQYRQFERQRGYELKG
ncbi:cell filamentation protein Fic [Burkholderia sp. Leaf177]|uniref:Fic/DOC family protein n=1 Tax=Burkholderia sp. Leaf177 TaxID=1736287 RepID=UPI000700736A|nr:Fic family protein [Burkholderia sp. Leaf177]KQR84371.1 cell filamentation protein Fic [Burkholderia sp. Leaf177]